MEIVLPFNPVADCVDFRAEWERDPLHVCHDVALNGAGAGREAIRRARQGQPLRPPLGDRLEIASGIHVLFAMRLGTKHIGGIKPPCERIEGGAVQIRDAIHPSEIEFQAAVIR